MSTTPVERTFVSAESAPALVGPPEAAPEGAYAFRAAPPALRPFVADLHTGAESIGRPRAIDERVLPDGAVHLVFHLADAPEVLGEPRRPAASEALGASARPAVIRMTGRVEGVGVRLSPGGAAAVLGVPASALAGGAVPLDALWGRAAHEALERLADSAPGAARLETLERILAERLADAPPPPAVAAAAARAVATGGETSVRALAERFGLGERRVQQLFREHVGLPPKVLARLARFHAALERARRGPWRGWSHVAHACGYADHAHLTHDVRAFAGITPSALRARLDFGFPQAVGWDAGVGCARTL